MVSIVETFSILEIAGILGAFFYLGSYAALQFGAIDANGILYPILNFVAASCVLLSLFESFNLSSALIQVSWISISLYGITRLLMTRNKDVTEKLETAN